VRIQVFGSADAWAVSGMGCAWGFRDFPVLLLFFLNSGLVVAVCLPVLLSVAGCFSGLNGTAAANSLSVASSLWGSASGFLG